MLLFILIFLLKKYHPLKIKDCCNNKSFMTLNQKLLVYSKSEEKLTHIAKQ